MGLGSGALLDTVPCISSYIWHIEHFQLVLDKSQDFSCSHAFTRRSLFPRIMPDKIHITMTTGKTLQRHGTARPGSVNHSLELLLR
jgi:hypothetical protein